MKPIFENAADANQSTPLNTLPGQASSLKAKILAGAEELGSWLLGIVLMMATAQFLAFVF